MKRIVIFLTIVFSIMVLSFIGFYSLRENFFERKAATNILTNSALPVPEIEEIKYCELVKNPEKYDGKTVRLNARLYFGLEGSWFSNADCGIDNGAIVSSYNKGVWNIIRKAREQKGEEFWRNELDLVVTGKFKNVFYKNVFYNEGGLITPFRFEILKIEKVISTPRKSQ